MLLWNLSLYAQTPAQQIQTLDSLGRLQWKQASYHTALSYYMKAFAMAQKTKDEAKEAHLLNYIGIIYENKGDYDSAFKHHFHALRLREKLNDKQGIAKSYVNIGIAYAASGQTEKGLNYYRKALQASKEGSVINKRLETHAFYHISTAYRRLKKHDSATLFAQKALFLAKEIKEEDIIIDAQNGLGLIATEQKDYAKGREYFQKVYDLANSKQDWLIVVNTLLHFSENYAQSKDYARAIDYAQKSLVLAQEHELKDEQKNAFYTLSDLYARQGNEANAYRYLLQYNALKDSIFSLQKNKQISELTIQYETEKKEQQIELLEKDKKLGQNTIYRLVLIIMLLLIISSFVLYGYQSRQTIQAQKEKLAQAEKAKLEAQLVLQEAQRKMEQERFEEQIAHKERELASTAMHIFQKNEMLNALQEKMGALNTDVKTQIKPLFQEIRNNIDLDKDWTNFQLHFVKVHPDFFTHLQQDFPALSQNELKLLAYIRMNLSNKEIASLLNITPKSMEMARYRLKKKFNLGSEDNLDEWLAKY